MAESSKECDFSSDQFDPVNALENPNISIPCEDVEEMNDLDDVRTYVHDKVSTVAGTSALPDGVIATLLVITLQHFIIERVLIIKC